MTFSFSNFLNDYELSRQCSSQVLHITCIKKGSSDQDVDVIEKLEIYRYLVQFLNIVVESRS